MSAPEVYATIIVPAHDRDTTLRWAVRSIQSQTVANIEIVISGDGVSDAVRAVALGLASGDPRVVFHDWPKAPKRGGENRDRAVGSAKAERILYSDDDDLLLSNHVETLGAMLDDYDAVDSAPASVSRSGRVQVGIVNHSRGAMREALAARTAKAVFDTNFGHRKSAYERVGSPWRCAQTSPSLRRVLALQPPSCRRGPRNAAWCPPTCRSSARLRGATKRK